MLNSGGAQLSHHGGWLPTPRELSRPTLLITTAVSLHLGHFVHRRFLLPKFRLLLHPSLIKDAWSKRGRKAGFDLVRWSDDALSETWSSCLLFFSGDKTGKGKETGRTGSSSFGTPRKSSFDKRHCTNALLAINLMLYFAQVATQGKLMLWGAKINSLVSRGQLWRLVTSSFLHANIGHLMVNCYSLNSVGPTAENLYGPRRFLAIYFASAVASSAMSYYLCQAPAVGASGAIFGLVGSVAVFVMRHRGLVGGGTQELQHIANVIILNMVVGVLSKGIDNWGHLGGLLGGAAASWFLGPAWRHESISDDGRRVLVDRAPIFFLVKPKRPQHYK